MPEKVSLSLLLGCGPDIRVTLVEGTNGELFIQVAQADPSNPVDIDGLFFDFADGVSTENLGYYPDGVSTINPWAPVTNVEHDEDGANSLSNGATLMDTYDMGVQFGLTEGSTEGEVFNTSFTMWSGDGPLTIDSLDLSSFAVVGGSDGPDGQVYLVNESGEPGPVDPEPETNEECAFLIEGDVNTEVVLTQLENGDIQVSLEVLGGDDPDATGQIGDIRGLFFNIGDDSKLSEMSVTGDDVTGVDIGANSVVNLGNGINMNGNNGSPAGGYDAGVKIGTPGMGGDDIQFTTFTLSHPDGLSLSDFSGETFGLRLTSVGNEDSGNREGSLKLVGECEDVPDPEVCHDQYALADVMALMTQPMEDPGVYAEQEDTDEEEFSGGDYA